MSRIIKASDPGSAWFGGGSRSPSAAGSTRNVRLVATGVAALVSVLGFALFLHLYICHVRRRNRRRAARAAVLQTEAAEAAAKAPKGGLEPSAIAALPTEAYRETGEAGCGECAICLGAVQEGDAVRVLPACSHVFHVACVDTWLGSSSSCPVCRAGVEPPPLPPPAAAAWVQEKQQGLEKEDAGSSAPPCGLGASLMRMLSRERPSTRRPQQGDHAVEMEDLESQQPQQQHAVNN